MCIRIKTTQPDLLVSGVTRLVRRTSNCGMEVARDAVNIWQNQFDEIILNTAKDTGVPANLLKNLFATESQFWPGNSKNDDDNTCTEQTRQQHTNEPAAYMQETLYHDTSWKITHRMHR